MEIEVKVKVTDVTKLKKDIENLGASWSEVKNQIDAYYKRQSDIGKVEGFEVCGQRCKG